MLAPLLGLWHLFQSTSEVNLWLVKWILVMLLVLVIPGGPYHIACALAFIDLLHTLSDGLKKVWLQTVDLLNHALKLGSASLVHLNCYFNGD